MKKIVPDLFNIRKIWGPPGTGKTTRLLKILKEKLDYGYSKDKICLVGYARATAATLKERCKNELNFNEEELETIRTLHALCKNALPKPHPQLITKSDKDFLNKILNWPKSEWITKQEYKEQIRKEDDEEEGDQGDEDKKLLTKKLELISRGLNNFSHGDSWLSVKHYFQEEQEDYTYNNIHLGDLEYTFNVYREYKKHYGLMDFTDMLLLSLDSNIILPSYNIIFVDECQDINPLMWAVLQKMFKQRGDKQIYLAGDDDQSIYGFNCANPEIFLNMECHGEEVLDKSYRLPKTILDFSQKIIKEIAPRFRKEKVFGPKTEKINGKDIIVPGEIKDVYELWETGRDFSKEDWIMCARTSNRCYEYKKELVTQGLLWKSKNKSGVDRDVVFSIKNNVVDTLNVWHSLQTGAKVEARQICDFIQEVKRPFLKVKKKDCKKDKSTIFPSDNTYDKEDLKNKKIFVDDFSFDEPWYKYIEFKEKHVQNAQKKINGVVEHLFLDSEEVNEYIKRVWEKDRTLRKTDILVGTIHSVKGMEATNVIVCDVWSSLCMKNYKNKTPFFRREEIRCAYVGVTRSKRSLFIFRPNPNIKYGEDSFPLLENF